MATFVLVHGAWHGGWCWDRVTPLLRAAGHAVVAPTLTGLGERRAELHPAVDLDAHVADVLRLYADRRSDRSVLVGHSYGAMVTTAVAAAVPERLARLVYLDAFVPADGQALFDLLPPARRDHHRRRAREEGDGWLVPPPPASALGVSGDADGRWLEAKLTPQPLRTFEQAVRLPPGTDRAVPRAYVHCTVGPLAPSFAPFAAAARAEGSGWDYAEIAAGHDAMVTAPERVAAVLLAWADDPSGGQG